MKNQQDGQGAQWYFLIDQYWKWRQPENQGSEERLNVVEQDYLTIGNYYPQWLELQDDYEAMNNALNTFYGKQWDIYLYEQLCQLIANFEKSENFRVDQQLIQELAVLANKIVNEAQNSWQTLWAVFQKLNQNTTLDQNFKDHQIEVCFGNMQKQLLNYKWTKTLENKQTR